MSHEEHTAIQIQNTKSTVAAWLSLTAALLALIAALIGLVDESLYNETVTAGNINKFLRVGSLAQDMVTVPLAALTLVLSIYFLSNRNIKAFITLLGLVGYLFYAYGLYTMQGQYTDIYLLYLAVFGLSVYALVYGLSSFNTTAFNQSFLPKSTRISIAIFLTSILMVLVPVWLMLIVPAIASHKPADTYGVFVLDLTIVFPALAAVTFMLFRSKPNGNVLAGVALFKAFTVCLSVAFGEWYGPYQGGFNPNVGNLAIFGTLTLLSGVLFIVYLRHLKFINPN